MSWPDFNDLKVRVRSMASLAASSSPAADLNDEMGFAEPLQGSAVTVNIFEVMGIKPVIGREFSEADGQPGSRASGAAVGARLEGALRLRSAESWGARSG